MSQLTKRVVLIHELGQLGRSEELLHCCGHRLDVDQGLRRNAVLILCRHPLADNSLQSGKTDPVLVLEELSDRTDTSVAQMVDIVVISHAVLKMHIVVDGRKDIFLRDMLRDQVVDITLDQPLHLIDISCRLLDDACQDRIVYLLLHADFLRIDVHNSLKVYHHIGKDLDISRLVLSLYPQVRSCRVLDRVCDLSCDLRAFLSYDLTCHRAHYILCEDTSCDTVFEHQLLIEFIASDFRQVIPARIEEHARDQTFRTVYRKRLSRTDLFVQL